MARMKDLDRRGSPISWFVALAVLIFGMYSLVVAATTAEDCDAYGGRKQWEIIPPEWECNRPRP
jgi:hypothetical protein